MKTPKLRLLSAVRTFMTALSKQLSICKNLSMVNYSKVHLSSVFRYQADCNMPLRRSLEICLGKKDSFDLSLKSKKKVIFHKHAYICL